MAGDEGGAPVDPVNQANEHAEARAKLINKPTVKKAIDADSQLRMRVDQVKALAEDAVDPSADPLVLLGVDPATPAKGSFSCLLVACLVRAHSLIGYGLGSAHGRLVLLTGWVPWLHGCVAYVNIRCCLR